LTQAEGSNNSDTIGYPEAITELGSIVRRAQDIVASCDGVVRVHEIAESWYPRSAALFEVRLSIRYDPQKFHEQFVDTLAKALRQKDAEMAEIAKSMGVVGMFMQTDSAKEETNERH
jgi:hypothetical protein